MSDSLTSSINDCSATITIRLIKSFQYRTVKSIVLHNINLHASTTATLTELLNQEIIKYKPFASVKYDTFKIYTNAHGSKTMNLVINFDHEDSWYLKEGISLWDQGVRNETEISWFVGKDYEEYKANPETKW